VNLPHARAYLGVIKAEERRRSERLDREDPNIAYDQWLFTDAPFIGDLCLVFLVALWHHVERQLLHFAACAADQGEPLAERLTRDEYQERVKKLLKDEKRPWLGLKWRVIEKRLGLPLRLHFDGKTGYERERLCAMEALRSLANAYKHDPSRKPSGLLLDCLDLDKALTYAEMSESHELQRGLARILALSDDASHCEIAEGYVGHVEAFLQDVQNHCKLSTIKGMRVSTVDGAH
jgi:hypothetical protein